MKKRGVGRRGGGGCGVCGGVLCFCFGGWGGGGVVGVVGVVGMRGVGGCEVGGGMGVKGVGWVRGGWGLFRGGGVFGGVLFCGGVMMEEVGLGGVAGGIGEWFGGFRVSKTLGGWEGQKPEKYIVTVVINGNVKPQTPVDG